MSDNTFSDWNSLEPESIPNHKASEDAKPTLADKAKDYLNKSKATKEDNAAAKPRARAPRKTTRKVSTPKRGAYVEDLESLYTYAGMGVMLVDPVCGNAVISSAESCAKAIDDLAYQNESVRRVLDGLTQGSAVTAVVMAHLPIIMAVASHHSLIPFIKLSAPVTEPDAENVTVPTT